MLSSDCVIALIFPSFVVKSATIVSVCVIAAVELCVVSTTFVVSCVDRPRKSAISPEIYFPIRESRDITPFSIVPLISLFSNVSRNSPIVSVVFTVYFLIVEPSVS